MSDPTPKVSPFNESSMPAIEESFIAIAVGNSRTRIGVLKGKECVKAKSITTSQTGEIISFVGALFNEFDFPSQEPVILMSSVNSPGADEIEGMLRDRFSWSVYRIGRDLQLPIRHALSESGEKTVGQDRLLCAIGAFDVVKQACVVVDMGTAITVDFVDGEGVFHGGAILPGVSMMLESLHEQTSSLPKVSCHKLDPKENEPAKDTTEAMVLGVCAAANGAIRFLAERYARFYEGYPQIIATGGDMGLLEDDDLIEAFVPDLQIHGIRVACAMVLGREGDEPSADDG